MNLVKDHIWSQIHDCRYDPMCTEQSKFSLYFGEFASEDVAKVSLVLCQEYYADNLQTNSWFLRHVLLLGCAFPIIPVWCIFWI